MLAKIVILACLIFYSFYFSWIRSRSRKRAKVPVKPAKVPVSVNYHFTRKVST